MINYEWYNKWLRGNIRVQTVSPLSGVLGASDCDSYIYWSLFYAYYYLFFLMFANMVFTMATTKAIKITMHKAPGNILFE